MIIIEWKELLITAGLDEKEANIVCMLNQGQNRKASYLAKELKLSRLDAYNTLSKLQALESNGIKVVERQSIVAGVNDQNKFYLSTKAKRMGHYLEV